MKQSQNQGSPISPASVEKAEIGKQSAVNPVQNAGEDQSEPRTGYRPVLDERTERHGQYGMVRNLETDEESDVPNSESNQASSAGNRNQIERTEDAFDAEFANRQSTDQEGGPSGGG